ncbi:MAG: hypothetical protein RIE08_14535 [Acidimicrobiales bacterium]
MAQPQFVPKAPDPRRHYASPPRRPESWRAQRPGDLGGAGQPEGPGLGNQGPDQGYALRLARLMRDELILADGEHVDDVVAGCLGVATKRASLLGRAPVRHDLTAAFGVFGFLDPDPDPDLVALRGELFEEVAHHHHVAERGRIAQLVTDDVLRRPHEAILAAYAGGWRDVIAAP